MNTPYIINSESFQKAWIYATEFLKKNHWEYWNLITQISDPQKFDQEIHNKITCFAHKNSLLTPKQVAYTIFPHNQYKGLGSANKLYKRYTEKFYPWTRHQNHSGWGTYFNRMINYNKDGDSINQMDNIIKAINSRSTISKAAYTCLIQYPGSETTLRLGSPCLNYISIQLTPGITRKIGILSLYRKQEYLERAYGNFWGLCNLLCFLAEETKSIPGSITNISSHAYVHGKKTQLTKFLNSLENENF